MTPGRGDRHGALRLELEAHSRSSGQNTARILGLGSDDVARIHRIHTEQMQAFQRNPGQAMMWLQFAGADTAQDAALRDFEASQNQAAELFRPLQPAAPTAASPAEPMYPPASLVPGRASQPQLPLAALRAASEGVRALVSAACRGDWAATSSYLRDYARLSPGDLEHLGRQASSEAEPCRRALLSCLIVMRQGGEPLDQMRLQVETQAAQNANTPVYNEPPEREPGNGTGNRGGVTPGDRPSQRRADDILRGGGRFP